MTNRFIAKFSVMPSGLVKVSEGAGSRKSAHAAISAPSLSIVPNFKESPTNFYTDVPSYVCPTTGEVYFESISTDYDPFPSPNDCPQSPKLRAGWGLLGNKKSMSRKSSVNLRERMCAIELEYEKENTWFGTLTLPTDNLRSYEMIARYSAYLINRLNVWLSDNYSEQEFARCGVWEYQKRGALHYHFLLGSHCMDALSLKDFRYDLAVFWMSALEAIELESDTSFFSQKGCERDKSRLLNYEDLGQRFANVQIVEKSVCAYLSKYLSGSNHDKGKDKNGLRKSLFPVATWGQWNRKATELYKKYSLECEKIIWAKDYDDWSALKDILFQSIAKADGTSQIDRQNSFYKTTAIIAEEKGLWIIQQVLEVVEMVKNSGICTSFKDVFKFKRKRETSKNMELEQLIHDDRVLYFWECQAKIKTAKDLGDNLAKTMSEMLVNMLILECELREHLLFSPTMSNEKQLRLL